MGIFNQFTISDFRNPVNSFWIFARIEFEQEGEYPITFEFRTVEGDKIFEIQANVILQQARPSQLRPAGDLKIKFNTLKFPRHGSYELAIRSKDTLLQTVPVEVVVCQTL